MDNMDSIYRSYAQTVYKFLLAQCRDPDLAEELTQATFYQAVRSIGRFDGSCKVSTPCRRSFPRRPLPRRRRACWPRRTGWTCSG